MKKRIARATAALTLGILATLTATLNNLVAVPQDSGWGAPDTTHIAVDTGTTGGVQASVHVDDSGWG